MKRKVLKKNRMCIHQCLKDPKYQREENFLFIRSAHKCNYQSCAKKHVQVVEMSISLQYFCHCNIYDFSIYVSFFLSVFIVKYLLNMFDYVFNMCGWILIMC
jgi:hypothetical protein